jgi:formate-dependent nitrite reductase membrane component NrfD
MKGGRYIDTSLATLEGEASHQGVPSPQPPQTHDRPYLKPPVWIWSIPLYFFVGGAAGAAMTLGLAAQWFGGKKLRGFEERCRWVGAIGGGLGSALLIYDLGRKERFLYMLRVFRPTSPMSVGSWVLALATPLSAGSAMLTMTRGRLYEIGYTAGMGAGILGMPLATYTAVLLANTAVPLWSESRRTLPLLFGSSSVASLASVMELMPLREQEQAIVHRFGLAGRLGELAAAKAVEREAGTAGKPLHEGVSGALWTAATVLTASSLAVSLLPGRSRGKRIVSGTLGIFGGLCLRFAVFYGGKASALTPLAKQSKDRSTWHAVPAAGTPPSQSRA